MRSLPKFKRVEHRLSLADIPTQQASSLLMRTTFLKAWNLLSQSTRKRFRERLMPKKAKLRASSKLEKS
jgi:hypothetical protein